MPLEMFAVYTPKRGEIVRTDALGLNTASEETI